MEGADKEIYERLAALETRQGDHGRRLDTLGTQLSTLSGQMQSMMNGFSSTLNSFRTEMSVALVELRGDLKVQPSRTAHYAKIASAFGGALGFATGVVLGVVHAF